MSDELRQQRIGRGHLAGIAASFGFDYWNVARIVLETDHVEVTYIDGANIITESIQVEPSRTL